MIAVIDSRIRRFTEDEVSLLSAFADQAALALEKARLLNDAEREKDRSDALYRVSNLLAGAHDTDDVLELIVNEAARLVGAAGAWMRLLQGDVLVPGAATKSATAYISESFESHPTIKMAEGKSLIGQVMATKKPGFAEDAMTSELVTPSSRSRAEEYGFHGIAAIPLLANDRSVGVLVISTASIHLFTDDEVSLLTAFADQAALALEKARLLNEAETERERADSLYRISNRLAGAHDTDEVLDLIVNEAAACWYVHCCFVAARGKRISPQRPH